MKKILFVCVHNSGRSQMAEAFFNNYAKGKAQAFSAGTQPASHADRNVLQTMREIGRLATGRPRRQIHRAGESYSGQNRSKGKEVDRGITGYPAWLEYRIT